MKRKLPLVEAADLLQTRCTKRCLVGLLLFVVFLLAACSQAAPPVEQRLIVLGFDGMDPVLARKWMDDGSLPNFRKLATMGEFHPLPTSNPPQSPVAWSDFATGTGPGEHGIYDFLRRDPETYLPDFSISRVVPPQSFLSLFGMKLPLEDGEIINRRVGTPFWSAVEEQGGRSTVLRVPVTFPPDPIHRMMAGMGVPDLLGTQGTYTIYSTRPSISSDTGSSRSVRIRPDRDGHIESLLEGPADPLKPGAPALNTRLLLDPVGDKVRIRLGDADIQLAPGEWSDWITVSFKYFGPASAMGIVRVYLLSAYPRVQLYVSPIHIDPRDPVVPLSSPAGYAAEMEERFGLYHTIGMPEETWSLNDGHLTDHAFLEVVRKTLQEQENMFYDALDHQDSDLVVSVFVQTDRVSHMFYRGIDPQHALYEDTDAEARDAIHWIYAEADRVLGETMQRMGSGDRLIVLSDHGFAPFRRAVHLNRWLADQNLLVLEGGNQVSSIGFTDVDWSRTRAYALGLNSLYINKAGREAQGIVGEEEAEQIKQQVILSLPHLQDPETGLPVVRGVFDGELLYPANANSDAPDLVIGYEPGFRASWQTTLGGVPASLIDDNNKKWSGDHCISPDAVPGVLFTSFKTDNPLNSIQGIARYARDFWKNSP
ncbi:MAG: alkaline phosphatase family protein [Xanthomonadales bacterium]|nr:alkaline phosphatase family protein [Xanthomonadales bacterium]